MPELWLDCFFFFSSRRRHTRLQGDWSSDVCSSDLVHTLSVGEMQRVEIIRALLTHPRVLILDEPTSVLTPQAVEKLFVVLRRLASEGCSILYISHKLHEIRSLCTACTVLRGDRKSTRLNSSHLVISYAVFCLKKIMMSLLAAMGSIHGLMMLVLSVEQAIDFLVLFAFIPARYDVKLLSELWWVPGWCAEVWTFLTYAFIHGNLMHLGFNGVWLLAFGTPVARRFGPLRFLIFFLFSAAVGAALHLAVHSGERLPMVGASAAISGAIAAAMRFPFQPLRPPCPFER